MGYGLSVYGKDTANNDFYVIDSDKGSYEYLGIKAGGFYTSSTDSRASVAADTPISGYSGTGANLIFARTDTTEDMHFYTSQTKAAGSFVIGGDHEIISVGTTSFTAVGAANNNVGTNFVATGVGSGTGTARYDNLIGLQAVKYVLLHRVGTLTNNVNGTGYGLQVYNSSDQLMFDSRKVNQGLEIHKIHDQEAFPGGKWSEMSSSDKTANLVWDGSSQTAAAWRNTYVSIMGSHYYYSFYSALSYTHIALNSFYFDNSAQKIYFQGFLKLVETAAGINIDQDIKNAGTILVGEFKE